MILDLDKNKKRECIAIAAIAALVLLAVVPAGVAAADTLFEEDFQTINWVNNWTDSSGPFRTSSAGNYYLHFDSDNDDIESIDIDTRCYENITLSFDLRTDNLESGDTFRVYYRTGGGTYQQIQNYTNNQDWDLETINLPAATENVSDLQIQFWFDRSGSSSDHAYIDNVTVTGDWIAGCSIPPCMSQTWHLSNTEDATDRYIMHRGSPVGSDGDPSIEQDGNTGDTVIWIANESAATNVTFPAGNWTFIARRTDGSGDRVVDVSIGVWTGSAFTADGVTTTITIPADQNWGTFTIAASEFTVPQGQWLALRIENNHGDNQFNIDASGSGQTDRSRLTSPCSDPGYPSGGIPSGAALNVTKVAETGAGPYYPGQTITYNITVCNIGNQTLDNVRVNDPLLGSNHVFGTLVPVECNSTEEFTHTVTLDDACSGWINNTVYVYNGSILYNASSENVPVNCPPAEPGSIDLYLLMDGSTSINATEFGLQKQGLAAAINKSDVVPQDGSVSICVIQFATTVRLEVPLTKITSQTVADQVSADILNINQLSGNTNISGAFYMAIANFPCCPSDKQVIDLSTDGVPTTGGNYVGAWTARNASIAPGLFDVVNTLGVGDGIDAPFLQNLTYPGLWNDTPGFYSYADNFSAFSWAIEQKIIRELGAPKINVTKTVDSTGPYHADDKITYNITVCNIGNVNVTNVTINDPLLGLTDVVLVGTLEPDNCTSMPLQNYTVTEDDVCTGWINNTVNASADYGTQTIYNETFANVSLGYDSGINVTKVAAAGPYDLDDNITYNITVCNIGKLTVTNVMVNDPILGLFNHLLVGTLAPGNCSSKEFNYTVTQCDCTTGWINNTIQVNGTDYCGNNIAAIPASSNVTVVCKYKYCISGQKMNETEDGLVNWTINVKNSTDVIVATTTTDATGYWQVCGLVPGNYTVCEEPQKGWEIDSPPTGCYDIQLVAENITDLNFMNCECNGSISNFVWLDTNQNGIQDVGEPGIEGVIVKLYLHASPATLIGTTVTDGTGFYIFDQLCPGNYSLQFIPPAGFVFTLQNQGGDDEDSDANPATGSTVIFTLGDGEVNPTIDVGLYYSPQEVPAFTPAGLIALVSALATIAAVTITRRKRR